MEEVTLVSNPMVHTPGIFRWVQNMYQTGTKSAAINTLMSGYGLSRSVAKGLLSGEIPVVIDDNAETVTFIRHL